MNIEDWKKAQAAKAEAPPADTSPEDISKSLDIMSGSTFPYGRR